jgi:hypothetical protein
LFGKGKQKDEKSSLIYLMKWGNLVDTRKRSFVTEEEASANFLDN